MSVQSSKLVPAAAEQPTLARWSGITATALIALAMTGSGVLYLLGPPKVVATFQQLGYPEYFRKLLGLSKILGVLAIVGAGRYPRLREWAYAGITFDLIAGALSHALTGEPPAAIPPMITLGVLLTSYFFWHRRRLPEPDRAFAR